MILPVTTGSYIPQGIPKAGPVSETEVPFAKMLGDAIGNLQELEAIKNEDTLALAIGEIDDPSVLAISALRYDTALEMLVQMRDRLLNSYNELLRINI